MAGRLHLLLWYKSGKQYLKERSYSSKNSRSCSGGNKVSLCSTLRERCLLILYRGKYAREFVDVYGCSLCRGWCLQKELVHEQTNSKNIFDKTIPFELDALCAALYFNWTLFFYVHSLLTVPAISKIPYFWLLCRAFWLFSYGCLSDGPQLVTISCVVVSSVKHSCLCFTRYVTLSAIVASCYRSYLAQAFFKFKSWKSSRN